MLKRNVPENTLWRINKSTNVVGTALVSSALLIQLVLFIASFSFSNNNGAVDASFQSLREKQYGKWPKPSNITWMFEASFPNDSRKTVETAVTALNTINGGNCIKFNLVTAEPSDGTAFIIVSNRTKPNYRGENVTASLCDSTPGRWKGLNNNKVVRNYLTIITSNATGFFPCLNQRVIMGLFFRTLGFFSELQRPDRDNFVTFNTANLATGPGFTTEGDTAEYARKGGSDDGRFVTGDVVSLFDGDSITIPPSLYLSKTPSDASMVIFAPKEGTLIGQGNNVLVSRVDCITVAKLYKRESNNQCDLTKCGQ